MSGNDLGLDEARARDDGGSGLGLAIAERCASGHGGGLRVERSATGGLGISMKLEAV